MTSRWKLLVPAALAAGLATGCGGGSGIGGVGGFPLVNTTVPVSEAVYVADGTSGVITTFAADPTNSGTLTPIQESTGASQVTDIIPTPDGQNLFSFQPGAIDVLIVDHNQADTTVGQIINTEAFTLSDAATGLTNAVSGSLSTSGQILYVLGTTNAGLPTVAAFAVGAGDSLTFLSSIQVSNTAVGVAAPNGITVQSTGSQDEILVALQQANGVVALAFNGTTFTGPGNTGVATVDTSTNAVASLNGVLYAAGPQLVQAFTMAVNADGADLTVDGNAVSATNTTGNSSMTAGLIAGQQVVMVGNTNAANALAAIPIVTGGALTTATFNNFEVLGFSNTAVGVNALGLDAAGTVFTADNDASATSLVFPTGVLGQPQETPAASTGGTVPNSLAVLGI